MIFDNHHANVISSLDHLASVYEKIELVLESTELRTRQIKALEQTKGINDEDTIMVLQNLAVMLRNHGNLEKAEPLQRESVLQFIQAFGEDNIKTAIAYSGLGKLLTLKGEFKEAKINYLKALAIRQRDLGEDAEQTKLVRQRLEEILI